MKYSEILNLLDKGLTPAQIMELNTAPAPVQPEPPAAAPQEEPAPVPQQDTEPAWAVALRSSIDRMTNAMHAQAIMTEQQPEMPKLTPEQALASVLMPPGKKE